MLGATGSVSAPGFVSAEQLDEAIGRALCLVLPSRREGYGMVVVEAASKGVPTVTVAAPDNAAVEHIEHGVNGLIASGPEPNDLADAILEVAEGGAAMRDTTADWFAANAQALAVETSLERVREAYRAESARR